MMEVSIPMEPQRSSTSSAQANGSNLPGLEAAEPKENGSNVNTEITRLQNELDEIKYQLRHLEEVAACSVCLERLGVTPKCCVNGHAVCARCHTELVVCPSCNLAFSKEKHTVLYHMLEEMPKTCHNIGCTRVKKDIEEHEKWCGFRTVKCKVCLWSGPAKDLLKHVQLNHPCTPTIDVEIQKPNGQREKTTKVLLNLDGSLNTDSYIIYGNHCFWYSQKCLRIENKISLQLTWIPSGICEQNMFTVVVKFQKQSRFLVFADSINYESLDAVSASFVFHLELMEPFTVNGLIEYSLQIRPTDTFIQPRPVVTLSRRQSDWTCNLNSQLKEKKCKTPLDVFYLYE